MPWERIFVVSQEITLIGFGSQGSAWAESLRDSGWDVSIFLSRKSNSYSNAAELGFEPKLLADISSHLNRPGNADSTPALIAFLCPDDKIGEIYQEFLAPLPLAQTLVLAHGFAVYADKLKPQNPEHQPALLAPKAIGPKLRDAYQTGRGQHSLSAAFFTSEGRETEMLQLALGLGFKKENLIAATFEQETIGDLISEQGLLCGGVFTLLEWTIQSMRDAGIPERLIREECFTELELVAGLLKERGPASTLRKISTAAQAGAALINEKFSKTNAKEEFEKQVRSVLNKDFVRDFDQGDWKERFDQWLKFYQKEEEALGFGELTSQSDSKPDNQLERKKDFK
jgi:ketol-acid reductoisomerase